MRHRFPKRADEGKRSVVFWGAFSVLGLGRRMVYAVEHHKRWIKRPAPTHIKGKE
jgi:hypothetical protein